MDGTELYVYQHVSKSILELHFVRTSVKLQTRTRRFKIYRQKDTYGYCEIYLWDISHTCVLNSIDVQLQGCSHCTFHLFLLYRPPWVWIWSGKVRQPRDSWQKWGHRATKKIEIDFVIHFDTTCLHLMFSWRSHFCFVVCSLPRYYNGSLVAECGFDWKIRVPNWLRLRIGQLVIWMIIASSHWTFLTRA